MKAAISKRLLAPLFDTKKDVATLARGLSCVADMQLLLFREHRTAFMTGQLYHDTQATIRGIFYIIAQAKVHCPAEPLFMFQIGTDGLEQLFAMARTLNHSSNFDIKDLGDRLGAGISMEEIYSRNAAWKQTSRRLNDTVDHNNPPNWLDGGKYKDAPGNCDTREVNVADCWMQGRSDAVQSLKLNPNFSSLETSTFTDLEEAGITMFKPFG